MPTTSPSSSVIPRNVVVPPAWTALRSLLATIILLGSTVVSVQAETFEFRESGFFATPSGEVKVQWDASARRFRLTTRAGACIDFTGPASQDGTVSPWYEGNPKPAIDAAQRKVGVEAGMTGGGTCSVTLSERDGGVLVEYGNSLGDSPASNLRILFPVDRFAGKTVSWPAGKMTFPVEFQPDQAAFLSDWENKVSSIGIALDDDRTLQLSLLAPYKDLTLSDCRSWKEANYHLSMNMLDGKAALFLKLVDRREAATRQRGNLIGEGSSFETGPDGMLLTNRYSWNEKATVFGTTPEFDATTAVHGSRSLKLVCEMPQQRGGRFTFVGVVFKRTLLGRGKTYTMSAWLKADRPGLQTQMFCGESSWSGEGWKPIPVGTEWKRYHVEFTADTFEKSGWWIPWISLPYHGEGTLWIDAVQLEEGVMTDYQPSAPVEFGVEIAKPNKLFERSEACAAVLRIRNNAGTPFAGTMAYEVVDYWGRKAAEGSVELRADPGSGSESTLRIGSLPCGYYRLRCSFPGEAEEAIFGVYRPQPLQRLPDDWPLACHNDPTPITRQLGFGMIRAFQVFEFREVAKNPDSFDFTVADRFVAEAEACGLPVMPILGDFRWPVWAQTAPIPPYARARIAEDNVYGRKDRLIWPTIEAWKRYVGGVVGHYKGRITYFEIHNEPNLSMNAAEYTPYLKAAYEAAKEANPDCRIVGLCATSDFQGKPDAFMRPVLDLGGHAFADLFSVHMYDQKSPEQSLGIGSDRALEGWRTLVASVGGRKMDFWHTEKSYIAEEQGYSQRKVPAPVEYCDEPQFLVKSQKEKSDWMIRETLLSAIGGGRGKFFWFGEFFEPRFISHRIFQPYVLDHTEYDDSPKPQLIAANGLAWALTGMHTPVRQLAWGQSTRCALFSGTQGTMAALWRSTGDARLLVPVATKACEILDFFGEAVPAKPRDGMIEVAIGASPTYLRFPGMDAATCDRLLQGVKFAAWDRMLQTASMVAVDGRPGWRFAFVNPQLSAIDAEVSVACPPGWTVASTKQRLGAVAAGARAETTFLLTGHPARSDGGVFTFTNAVDGKTQVLEATCLPFASEAQLMDLLAVQDGAVASRVGPGAVVVDGDLGEWSDGGAVSIATERSLVDVSQPGAWKGPYDSAATLRLRWDDDCLYVAARIFDDRPLPPRDAKAAYEWDCLELFLSPDGTAVVQGLLFPFAADHKGPKVWWLHAGSDLGSRVACRMVPHGYVIETAIPWAGLGMRPRAGASLPFTFHLDDTDAAGLKRRSVLVWQGDTSNFTSPKQWGTLKLQ